MKRIFFAFCRLFIKSEKTRLKILSYLYKNEIKWSLLANAIADPYGHGMLNLMMNTAGIKERYRDVFFKIGQDDICIDCGTNTGIVSDIILRCGGISYAFEPSKDAFMFLNRKYKDNPRINLINAAVSNKNGETIFNTDSAFDGGAHITNPETPLNYERFNKYTVKVIRLTDFIKNILSSHKKIYLLKLDVEGEEFNILEDLLKTETYKNIDYIFCETHERFGKTLKARLKTLKKEIKTKNIKNLYLDWI